jgi:hypothetical protein
VKSYQTYLGLVLVDGQLRMLRPTSKIEEISVAASQCVNSHRAFHRWRSLIYLEY